MSGDLGHRIAGTDDAAAPQRDDGVWLLESIGWLALMATTRTYADQPGLWRLGEDGRARTVEDFTHHLRAAVAGELQWREHLRYSLSLFEARGFPHRWLRDAFPTLSKVIAEAFGDGIGADVRARLDAAPALLEELAVDAGIDLDRPTRYDEDASARRS